jgi:hypothetical protein
MQINVMETRIDKRCIEFVANHIAQYGSVPSVWDTWQAALEIKDAQKPTTNIRSLQLLARLHQYITAHDGSDIYRLSAIYKEVCEQLKAGA